MVEIRKETYANKLLELMGLSDKVEVPDKLQDAPKKKKNNFYEAVNQDEIQSFREAQGVIYFLQAPALFTMRNCNHCGEPFLVSRKFVGACSYTCISKGLEEVGIKWTKGDDLEALAQSNVYEGNEPIWIRNLHNLEKALEVLKNANTANAE